MTQQAMVQVYIGLGSNLDKPVEQIRSARQALAAQASIQEQAFSSLYRSAPMGPKDQPDFINAVMAITTDLDALTLLHVLQEIERQHGRVRKRRWGERTLDLDILLYGNEQINQPELIVPHSGLAEREFVLYPLREIVGDELLIPGKGRLGELIQHCPENGLERLNA